MNKNSINQSQILASESLGFRAYRAPLKTAEVSAMCDGVVAAFPERRQRVKALKAVLWRLRGPLGEFVGLNRTLGYAFVSESEGLIFDGRDNEQRKLATYEAALGPLTVEVIPQCH